MLERYFTTFSPIGWRPEGIQSAVNVDDCADGLIRIAERGTPGGEYLMVAEWVTFREWFRLIALAAGRRPPSINVGDRFLSACSTVAKGLRPVLGSKGSMVGEYLATMGCNFAYVGDKARTELGWEPRPLDQGMREYAADLGVTAH